MLYRILHFLMTLTVRVFFKSIKVTYTKNIPEKGPLIIVANHPGTFMDPIVIATLIERPVFFLAKGEAFKSGIAKWLLPKLNMIPVYRKQDNESDLSKNEETFKKCFEHLEKNGVILIFPEGTSVTERKLRTIKTGAARIALGAEARNNFKLGLKILQIGLNYSDPHSFKSELFVKIDEPTSIETYSTSYQSDPVHAVQTLTAKIKERLEDHIIVVENERLDHLLKNIEILYKGKLIRELEGPSSGKELEFTVTKSLSEGLRHFSEKDPERVKRIETEIKRYLSALGRIGLTDELLGPANKRKSLLFTNILSILYIILGFPLFLYGFVNNYIPYRIPGWLASRLAKDKEYYGPIAMVTGLFTFLIFYGLQIYLAQYCTDNAFMTFLYALTLVPSGYFSFSYYHTVKKIRTRWLLISLFYKRSGLISELIRQRSFITGELDKAREEYKSLSLQNAG